MPEKRVTKDFIKNLAKKHGLSIKQTEAICLFAMGNMVKIIKDGEDIRLSNCGINHIYTDKKYQLNYIKLLKNKYKQP